MNTKFVKPARLPKAAYQKSLDEVMEVYKKGGNMNKIKKRGFASMEKGKQHDIASKGGKTAHKNGTAHKWTVEEAKIAGRKGGKKRHGLEE